MIEARAAHDALRATVAHRHAIEARQVRIAVVRSVLRVFDLLRRTHHFLQSRVVVGVRREHAVVDARLAVFLSRHLHFEHFLVLEQPHDVDHFLGLEPDPVQVLRAEPVRLEFHVASVTTHEGRAGGIGDVRKVAAAGEDADDHGADARGGGARLLADRVARGDVADLVTEHRGEFGLGVEVRHDAARDVDVAAGQRKRVDVGAVEHRERVLQVRTVARRRDALADGVDVLLQHFVVVAAVLLEDLRMRLAPDLDLLRLAHQHHVLAARDRVGGATSRAHDREHGEQCSGEPRARAGHGRLRIGVVPESRVRPDGQKVPGEARHGGAFRQSAGRPKRTRRPQAPRCTSRRTGRRQALAAYFLRKRSTRPPVSTIFCLPV